MTTPRLGAPELTSGQATPETTVNEQVRYLESGAGHFIFKDRDLATPPGSPADGDCYLVAASPTGAWAGHAGDIAFRVNTAWAFIEVIEGFTAWVNDENAFIGYDGAAWNVLATPSGSYLPLTGGTLSGDLVVPDEAYDATAWNGSLEVPTKNAIRDKIETLTAGGYAPGGTDVALADGGTGASLTDPNADRILFWDDSAGQVTWLAPGTNLSITGTTLDATTSSSLTVKDEGSNLTTAATSLDFVGAGVVATNTGGAVTVTVSGGGSGNTWQRSWFPKDAEFPTSNYATLDSRNSHPCLDFDTTTQETAYFSGYLPADYSGAGVTVHLYCSMTSATSGTVGWDVAFERMDASSLDIDADSFGSATTVTATTVPGTSGQLLKMSVNVSNGANMDSLAAGEMFRLRVRRDVANDTATGDAELLMVVLVSQ